MQKASCLLGFFAAISFLNSGFAANNIFSVGDVLKVNFANPGPGAGVLPDWNLMRENQTISAGSVVLSRSGQVISGVSNLGLSVNGSGSNMDTNTMNWPGFGQDPYYVSQAYGLIYSLNGGMGLLGLNYEVNLTISGLDTNFGYNVRIYRVINETLANFSAGTTNGSGYDFNTNINRQQVFNQSTLDSRLIFSNVRPNSSGQIIVSTASAQPTGMEAVVLEMVPEPSSASMLVLGMGGLLAWSQRRKSQFKF
jgi:hypothetical protein